MRISRDYGGNVLVPWCLRFVFLVGEISWARETMRLENMGAMVPACYMCVGMWGWIFRGHGRQ